MNNRSCVSVRKTPLGGLLGQDGKPLWSSSVTLFKHRLNLLESKTSLPSSLVEISHRVGSDASSGPRGRELQNLLVSRDRQRTEIDTLSAWVTTKPQP